ncbi:MAG: 4Fe-4S binding protein [Desulfitobacteriaceae bacterium]
MIDAQRSATQVGFLEIRRDWCKGCSLCVNACPMHILSLDGLAKIIVDTPEKCTKCGRCEGICPDFAIRVI